MINALTNRAKYFLTGKKTSIAIILLVLTGRVTQLVFFYNLHVDGMFQVMATQNFLLGHGISTSSLQPEDLSTAIYKPLIYWPPGYSLLLSPFYALFNHNYIIAALTLDILAAITLIFITRRILKLLDTPLYLINAFTLLTGCYIYYFYFMASSDSIAITFFLTGIYFTMLLIKRNSYSLVITAGISIFLFISGLIKYMFIPVVFIIPAFLILKAVADKQTQIKKTGFIVFLFLALAFSAILLYQKHISGTATYISQPTRGFYPENLLAAYPFLPASFISPQGISLLFPGQQLIESVVYRVFQCITLLTLLVAAVYSSRQLLKYGFKKISVEASFFYLVFFISGGITLLLAVLSLRVAPERNMPGHVWTYIQEPRYFGMVTVLLHLSVFAAWQYSNKLASKKLKYVPCFLLLLMLPEAMRGFLFSARRISRLKTEEYSWQSDYSFQNYAATIITKEQNKMAMENVAVAGSSYVMNYRVALYSYIHTLNELDRINDLASLNTKKPTLLLVILHEKELPKYQPFISDRMKKEAGYLDGYYFYTVHVYPH